MCIVATSVRYTSPILKAFVVCVCLFVSKAFAASITVTTANDVVDGNTTSLSALQSSPGADGKISLREAIIAANNTAGAHTITVPAGTYNLTRAGANEESASTGDLDIRVSSLVISGAGAATTIIKQTTPDRVFDINPANADGFTCTITGVTVTGGNASETYGGGGILYSDPTGGSIGTLSLSNCVIAGNFATNGPGAGVEVVDGNLLMTSCIVSNNAATHSVGGEGGGVDFFAQGSAATLNVDSCVISGNQAGHTNHAGGGLHITSDLGGTATIYRSIISGNQATAVTGFGGGLVNGGGALLVRYSRIFGNSAGTNTTGTAIYEESTGSVDATYNWWGTNSPSANLVGAGSGLTMPTMTPRLVLSASANPSATLTNAITSLTADIYSDNNGNRLPTNLFTGMPGFPTPPASVFGNAVLGSVTLNTSQLSNGVATGIFKAGIVGGNGSVTATVDGQTVTIPITINEPANLSCPGNISAPNDSGKCYATKTFAATVSGFPAPTVTYKIGATTITSPYQFPKGVSTVTCTATNSSGTNSCSFNVSVFDMEPPQFTCPTTINVTAFGNCPVQVNFPLSATDNCGTATVTTSPASGSYFPVGTNTVSVSAFDNSNNTNLCSFLVVVTPTPGPLLNISKSGTNAVVWWPSAATCYALQSAPGLATPVSNTVWTTYPGPFYSSGTNLFVTNSVSGNRVYRLKY